MINLNLTIFQNEPIIKALKKISINGIRELIVINKNMQLIGSISEGDIRKQILKQKKLRKPSL